MFRDKAQEDCNYSVFVRNLCSYLNTGQDSNTLASYNIKMLMEDMIKHFGHEDVKHYLYIHNVQWISFEWYDNNYC